MNWLEKKILLAILKKQLERASTMKLSTHLIWQAIALIVQAGNQYGNLTPKNWAPVVALVVGLGQVLLAWRAHYFNPDGTPAAVAYVPPSKDNFTGGSNMKMLLYAFVLILAPGVVVPLHAQNAPLPTTTVTTTFQAMALPSTSGTLAATVADAGVSFTPNSTLSFETLQAPSAPAGFGGAYGGSFAYQLNFLSKKLNDATSGSGYRFRFTLIGSGLGVTSANGNHIGGTARFRTEYSLGTSGTWNCAVEVGAARLPYVATGVKPIVSLGIPIRF